MRILTALFLLCVATLSLSGCAFMSDEDRDFYGKGWIKPSELDHEDSRHVYHDPAELGTSAHTTSRETPVFPTGY